MIPDPLVFLIRVGAAVVNAYHAVLAVALGVCL